MTDKDKLFKSFLNKKNRLNSSKFFKFSQEEQNQFLSQMKEYYPWIDSAAEACYCYSNAIKEKPICPICGKKKVYFKGYRKSCGDTKCKNLVANEERKAILKEKYGVENPGQLPTHDTTHATQARMKLAEEGKFQNWNKGLTKETDNRVKRGSEKSTKTRNEKLKSGEIVIWNKGLTKKDHPGIQKVAEAVSQRKRNNPLTEAESKHLYETLIPISKKREHSPEEHEKQRLTTLEKYGVESFLSFIDEDGISIYEKGLQAIQDKYGGWFPGSSEWKEKENEILNKMYETNIKKYGFKLYSMTEEGKKKIAETKRKNGTFNTSEGENEFFKELIKRFKYVYRQYRSEEYPFNCDFYLPEEDLYIEINYHWTHGGEPYDPSSKEHQEKLQDLIKESKIKKSAFYALATEVWPISDPAKQKTAKENNLNYFAFYNKEDAQEFLDQYEEKEFVYEDRPILNIKYTKEDLKKEFYTIQRSRGSYTYPANLNKTIYSFQPQIMESVFKKWKENQKLRFSVMQNRIAYLHKHEFELTDFELYRGMIVSGKVKTYSMFSPLWIKKFIKEHNVSSIYDPCGGWGHRLLGAWNIKYIYNDLNTQTYENCKKIDSYFGGHHLFYNKDASKFTPKESYEAIFTCPPYFNKEDYGVGTFDSFERYKDWWKDILKNSIKDSVKIIGVVIFPEYEEMIIDSLKDWYVDKRQELGSRRGSHLYNSMTTKDLLLIFEKKL